MIIELADRTEATVRTYFKKTQQAEIKKMLPQKARSAEEAVLDYKQTLLPGSKSFGRTILIDGTYVGDIWCYCIDKAETPNAMLSFCIFEKTQWNKGVASKAVSLFLREVNERFRITTIGAFTFSDNMASQKVLEKNGFAMIEEFAEDGKASKYYQFSLMK